MSNDEKILNNIFEETAAPNEAFVKRLEKDVVSEFNNEQPQNNFISLLFMKIPSTTLKYGVITLSALLFVGIFGSAGYYAYDTYYRRPALEKEQDILAKIAKQNPVRDLGSKEISAASDSDAKVSSLLAPDAMNRDYNYQRMVTTYDQGPSSSKCLIMVPYQGSASKEESTQYYSSKEDWFADYSKSIVFNNDDIYDYTLNVKDEQWSYKGGSYAVHVTNVERLSALAARESVTLENEIAVDDAKTISAPVDVNPTDSISSRFGEGAEISGTVKRDGREYYKVQWSYDMGCTEVTDKTMSSLQMDTKGVSVALADSKTYEIVEESLYINNTKESNRVYTRTVEESKKTTPFEAVAGDFVFDFNTTVKTFDASKFDYTKEYRNEVISYLRTNKLDLLYMSNSNYSLQSSSSSYVVVVPEYEKHLTDRAFYSSKAYGEKMYNEAKDMFAPYIDSSSITPVLQLSYADSGSNTGAWVTVSEYSKQYNLDELSKGMYYDQAETKNEGKVDVTVNGKLVSADVLSISRSIEPSAPDSEDGKGSSGSTVKSSTTEYFILFNFDNRSYSVQTSAESLTELKGILNFSVVSYTNSSLSKLLTGAESGPVDSVIMY